MVNKKKALKRDLILLLIWPVVASIVSFLLNANSLISMIIFMGVPSIYISYKNRKLVKKLVLFSLALSIPFTLVLEYLFQFTKSYISPSLFPLFLDFIPIEGFLWWFLSVFFVVSYYEYFLDNETGNKLFYPNMRYLVVFLLISIVAFFLALGFVPEILNIQFYYLKVGLFLGVLPILAVLLNFPNLYVKFLKAAVYFFYFAFIYEITALKLGHWAFGQGQYIGTVNIFGVMFPVEELFFWMILGAMATLSYYEFFDDDKK